MGIGLFFYIFTFSVVLICTAGSSVSFAAWYISKRRVYLLTCLLLVFYAVDLLLIFGNEYVYKMPNIFEYNFYAIYNSQVRTVLATCILLSMWSIVLNYCDRFSIERFAIPGILFFIASELVLWSGSDSAITQWLYYFMRIIFLLFIEGYALALYFKTDKSALKKRLEDKGWVWFVMLIATALIVFEDTYFILIFDPVGYANSNIALLYISERNISECLLVVFFTAFAIRSAVRFLHTRYIEPNNTRGNNIAPYLSESLDSYCAKHKLTQREKEVLTHVLNGATNSQIAEHFVVSIGTIKSHMHNILSKTNSSNRKELCDSFWSE